MIVGVIGSGAIGPDLAYGFVSALAGTPGAKVYLLDVKQEALDRGMARIAGYVRKGVSRGKLSSKLAAAIEGALTPTMSLGDLADCDYVLEAATERLPIKKAILADLEAVVRPDCLIGFATSGIPGSRIAADAKHPERCFVNHPFFPAWRSMPIEVTPSPDAAFSAQMVGTLKRLGKVPVVTKDVECFAADDIFCNYCSEAARMVAEGLATPAQIDRIVNDALGGGGPLNVLDLTRGNLLTAHCQELMAEASTGSPWFAPPELLTTQGNNPWHDRKAPGDPSHTDELGRVVLDRILAVLLSRTIFVVEQGICSPAETNWLTRTALGFSRGLLDVALDLGAERVKAVCEAYAADNPGFPIPQAILDGDLPRFRGNVLVERQGDLATVTVWRPEVHNALSAETMAQLGEVFAELEADDGVRGVVLTGYNGALAGADINELVTLKTEAEAEALCLRGQAIINAMSAMSKPVVAALDGPVLGGGAELVMGCHARVVGKKLRFAQPEVDLGIVPGYGGSQRLPRLVGLEAGMDMLRTARALNAEQAVAAGWAAVGPVDDVLAAARELIGQHLEGRVTLAPVDPAPMDLPATLPSTDIGQRSRTVDGVLVSAIREGLALPLDQGLAAEARAVGRCTQLIDFDIGMKNFMQNGPRVPAVFLHE